MPRTTRDLLRAAALEIFSVGAVQKLAMRTAAHRRRRLVLLYHRIGPAGPAAHEVLPTVSVETFEKQLVELKSLGEIVGLSQLLEERVAGPVRFALTYDDDEPCHVETVLPILRRHGVNATFFLSGRSLRGLGPYWWQFLEEAVRQRGVPTVARALRVEAATARELAAACEAMAPERALGTELAGLLDEPDTSKMLDRAGIRALGDAGMEIGFHTLEHPLMTRCGEDGLEAAVTRGRRELGDAAGARIRWFAYPHGRANAEAARAVRRAGYRGALTGSGRAIDGKSDPFLLSRWEPGSLTGRRLRAEIALRLSLPVAAPSG